MPWGQLQDLARDVQSVLETGLQLATYAAVAPLATERRSSLIEKKWKAVSILAGIVAASFGAGSGFALWGAGVAEIPSKIEAIEMRVLTIEQEFSDTNRLVADLICDLRLERGEEPPECRRGVLR